MKLVILSFALFLTYNQQLFSQVEENVATSKTDVFLIPLKEVHQPKTSSFFKLVLKKYITKPVFKDNFLIEKYQNPDFGKKIYGTGSRFFKKSSGVVPYYVQTTSDLFWHKENVFKEFKNYIEKQKEWYQNNKKKVIQENFFFSKLGTRAVNVGLVLMSGTWYYVVTPVAELGKHGIDFLYKQIFHHLVFVAGKSFFSTIGAAGAVTVYTVGVVKTVIDVTRATVGNSINAIIALGTFSGETIRVAGSTIAAVFENTKTKRIMVPGMMSYSIKNAGGGTEYLEFNDVIQVTKSVFNKAYGEAALKYSVSQNRENEDYKILVSKINKKGVFKPLALVKEINIRVLSKMGKDSYNYPFNRRYAIKLKRSISEEVQTELLNGIQNRLYNTFKNDPSLKQYFADPVKYGFEVYLGPYKRKY